MEEIKAGDIMIGCIVTVDNPKHHPHLKNVPMRVKEIFVNGDYAVKLERVTQTDDSNTSYSQFMKFIRPIPLTEDVLLKAGFGIGGYNLMEVTHPNHHRLFFVLGETYNSIWWNYNMSGTPEDSEPSQIEIKYLHELQNLFFILSKSHLTINL